MKVLKDLYGFVFGKSKPNKKRKLTPPSERPKNAYLKYHEYDLLNEGSATGLFDGNWNKDKIKWRKYFKNNKDLVMISIKNAEKMANVVSKLSQSYLEKIPDNYIVGGVTSGTVNSHFGVISNEEKLINSNDYPQLFKHKHD